jgi:VanZ family protein
MARFQTIVFYHAPPWVWALAIFVASSIPATYLPKIVLLSPDKLLHAAVFFVLAWLIYRSIAASRSTSWIRTHALTVTFLDSIVYAFFDEAHQHFVPGRVVDPFDVAADVVGISLFVLAIRTVFRIRTRRAEVALGRNKTE